MRILSFSSARQPDGSQLWSGPHRFVQGRSNLGDIWRLEDIVCEWLDLEENHSWPGDPSQLSFLAVELLQDLLGGCLFLRREFDEDAHALVSEIIGYRGRGDHEVRW